MKKMLGGVALLVALWLIITLLLVVSTFRMNRYEHQNSEATEYYASCVESAALFKSGTDALTDSALQYTLSGDPAELNAYFEEASHTQRREHALEMAGELEGGRDFVSLLQTSMTRSDDLMETECHAMKLRALSDGTVLSALPPAVADCPLTAGELAATPESQAQLAYSLLTEEPYVGSKAQVSADIDQYLRTALSDLQREYGRCVDAMERNVLHQNVLLVLFAVDLLCILAFLLSTFRQSKRAEEKLRETAIISGLTDDFVSVFYAEPNKNTVLTVKQSEQDKLTRRELPKRMTFEEFRTATGAFVCGEDLAEYTAKIDRNNLLREFSKSRSSLCNFRILDGEQFKYYRMKLLRLEQQDSREPGVLIGFIDVDERTRDQMLYERELEQRVKEQAAIIRTAMEREDVVQHTIIDGMATLVESRDMNTGTHIQNTQYYVTLLVRELQAKGVFPELENEELAHDIIFASVLHDIGKIFISDFLLNKPGKLTQDEFEVIKTHTTLGCDIVDDIFRNCIDDNTVLVIREIVRHHHEKWNGTGYPDELAGDDIPLSARITAVADVFDALISRRSYKESIDVNDAFEIIRQESGSHFDTRIVDAFFKLKPEIETYLDELHSDTSTIGKPFSHAYVSFEKKLQQESIISGLTSDFLMVFYAKPDLNRISLLRQSGSTTLFGEEPIIGMERSMSFEDFLSTVKSYIHPDDREKLCKTLDKDSIRSQLQDETVRFFTFRSPTNDGNTYYEIKLIRLGKADDTHFDVLVGVHDVSRSELIQLQSRLEAMEKAAVSKGLSPAP